jgi:hypothetical protein
MDHANFSRDSMFTELASLASKAYNTHVRPTDVWLCQKPTDVGLTWFVTVLINDERYVIANALDQSSALLNAVEHLQATARYITVCSLNHDMIK